MRKAITGRIPQVIALLMAAALIAVTAAARGLAGSGEGMPSPAAPPPTRAVATPSADTAPVRSANVGAAAANDPTIDLCATSGTVDLPGRPGVPIWGFVKKGSNDDCSDVAGTATLPGPALDVQENDIVNLNVTNALPAGHSVSIEAPGINFGPGATDADVGQTVTRTFAATAPGTYLYQSVGDGERQTAMGLYGALIVRPSAAGHAYDDPQSDPNRSAYDVETPVVLSAIDPDFNAQPDNFDMRGYTATYWLINGKSYPDTANVTGAAGKRVLLRYINAGYDNTTMALLGMHEHVIARDAQPLANPFDADAETIPAGASEDAIATVPADAAGLTNGFPLYNRQLHLANGAPTDQASPGGMMMFIRP
jgi:FtsP/CotA-like multicopper oxidase with cupredoxin domain